MAKDNKKQQVNNVNDEPTRTDLDFGAVPQELEKQLKEVDPLQNIPTFVPGKPGLEVGDKVAGYYKGTRRIYSDKFTAGKRDDTGKMYRDLHIFQHPTHGRFGVWSVGSLGFVMERLPINEYLVIEYTGLAEKPLKPGQTAPHTFRFKGVNIDLDTATMGSSEMDELEGRPALGRDAVRGAENRI